MGVQWATLLKDLCGTPIRLAWFSFQLPPEEVVGVGSGGLTTF